MVNECAAQGFKEIERVVIQKDEKKALPYTLHIEGSQFLEVLGTRGICSDATTTNHIPQVAAVLGSLHNFRFPSFAPLFRTLFHSKSSHSLHSVWSCNGMTELILVSWRGRSGSCHHRERDLEHHETSRHFSRQPTRRTCRRPHDLHGLLCPDFQSAPIFSHERNEICLHTERVVLLERFIQEEIITGPVKGMVNLSH